MLEQTTSILFSSLEPLTIFFLAYTYLLYVTFFKKGKLVGIKDLEELGKLLLLFGGIFMLIMPVIFGLIFLSSIFFATPLPESLTSDIQSIIFTILAFVFYPYMIKKDYEKKNYKFDIADWLFMIVFLQLLLIVFTLINLIYALISFQSNAISFFFGLFIFLGFLLILDFAYLKIVIINVFNLRKRSFFNKRLIKILISWVIISIILLFCYVNFPLS